VKCGLKISFEGCSIRNLIAEFSNQATFSIDGYLANGFVSRLLTEQKVDVIGSKHLIDHGDPTGYILIDVCHRTLELHGKCIIIGCDFVSVAVINELAEHWMEQVQRNNLLGKTRMTGYAPVGVGGKLLWQTLYEFGPCDLNWTPGIRESKIVR